MKLNIVKIVILLILITSTISFAQNQLGITSFYRKDGEITVAASGSDPTLVTTNLTSQTMIRNFINIQNTNAVPINVYTITGTTTNLVGVIPTNGTYSEKWPNADSTQFYVRNSANSSTTALISESWGR